MSRKRTQERASTAKRQRVDTDDASVLASFLSAEEYEARQQLSTKQHRATLAKLFNMEVSSQGKAKVLS
jgi:hypothetical protein